MRKTIFTRVEHCVGCNRCVRVCPIEMANLTYQDESGQIKVKANSEYCISCGACISACKNNARFYIDDFDQFMLDIEAGEAITLITAPSIKTNFPQWRQLLSFFRLKGVRKIYDVSLGADICIWAHLRYLEKYKPGPLITQPCASIVSYCEIHRHELLKSLSPIQSPMGCTSVYINKYEGNGDKIAAISPCIAKTNEFDSIGTINYNLTFMRILEYIEKNNIVLPEEASDFDHHRSGLGSIFPLPGGLKENIEFFSQTPIYIDHAEGRNVYPMLDEYAGTPSPILPDIFDVLNCSNGCNKGPGAVSTESLFSVNYKMNSSRRKAIDEPDDGYYSQLYKDYDKTFALDDFIRDYHPIDVEKFSVSEKDIQHAFELLGKDTPEKQNFDCSACGSSGCREMARKIALGVNIPVNCIVKSRDIAISEHEKNIELTKKISQFVELIHHIGDNLLSMDGEETPKMVNDSIEMLGMTLQEKNVYIWKNENVDGKIITKRLYGWSDGVQNYLNTIEYAQLPGIFNTLMSGEPVIKTVSTMNEQEKRLFIPNNIISTCAIPVVFRGNFWGFVSLNSDVEREYSDEEISLVASVTFMIAANIIERELSDSLNAAREDALMSAQAKSDFLSRMSHEIRTPMNAIIGMTEIAGNTDDLEKLRYCLSTIRVSSSHLLGLINDILDISKIEAGKLVLEEEPFDIEEMLIKICNFVNEKALKTNLNFHIIFDRNMQLKYIGDELKLSQTITNLFSNALKFTPEGGSIDLRVELLKKNKEHDVLRFTVSDTGIGMTEEQLSRLFTSFEQADGSITRRFGGTGLGLVISKSIVELMGGRMWAESVIDVGSDFVFEIRMKRSDDAYNLTDTERFNDIEALIIDSDMKNCDYLSDILSIHDVKCDTANDAGSGMKQLVSACNNNREYTLVLIDHFLAEEFMAMLNESRSELIHPESFVIMSPFLVWTTFAVKMEAYGITHNISKPIFPKHVNSMLIRHTESSDANALNDYNDLNAAEGNGELVMPDLSAVSLLLVEDIEINREIFTALLEDTGVNIDIAENGLIAVDKFKAAPEKYDIIIMDVMMPEMDGYQATRCIRASDIGNCSSVPIIAMTANAFQSDIEKGIESGMNDHLSKPLNIEKVIEKILYYTSK